MKKFTLFIMMLVMCATTTFAQTAITSPEDVKPGKAYWFANYWLQSFGVGKYPSGLYYPTEDARYHGQVYAAYYFSSADNMENPDQQFAFVEYDGKYYFYSVGADKFVTMKNRLLYTTDIPYTHVAVIDHPDYQANPEYYPLALAFGDDGLLLADYPASEYYLNLGCLYCFTPEAGSYPANATSWNLYEVGDLENADELTERLAHAMTEGKRLQEEAYDNLMYKIEEAEELISDIYYQSSGGGKIELQVEDPYSGNYIWCNDPDPVEGPIEGLIDGETSTFFHSSWHDSPEPEHWLQIDLENAIQNFSFSYHTRVFDGGNDFPDAIEVQGSNNGTTFETITVFDNDLPQASNRSWESGKINAEKAYKHLRFVVTAERTYFHMSEFALYESANITVEDEAYAPYIEYLTELVALTEEAREFWENNMDASIDEYNAYIAQIDEYLALINGLITGADDEKTVAYAATVEEILALEGIGYPGEAPRVALKAVIDATKAKPTTQARLDLEVALADYIKTDDITLPTDGEKYTLTFVTYGGRRNFLNYEVFEEEGTYSLSMVRDTITPEGLPLPETAVFTCVENEDGTFDFMTANGMYLTTPPTQTPSGSATGISEYQTRFTIEKMHPNGKCESDVTYEMLFSYLALNNNGTYMAPNSSGTTFYTGTLAHFMSPWTSAMKIEPWTGEVADGIESVVVENNVKGTYDLTGRKVENPTKGIYIVNGKITVIK